jgi:hypothetical protein
MAMTMTMTITMTTIMIMAIETESSFAGEVGLFRAFKTAKGAVGISGSFQPPKP